MSALDRRSFLVGAAGTTVLAACGSGDGTTTPTTAPPSTDLSFLVPAFPVGSRENAGTLAAGLEQRVPFVVRDEIDIMRDSAPSSLRLRITHNGETVVEETVSAHVDGIITPYFPLRLTFPERGEYSADLPDFPAVDPTPFVVTTRDLVEMPQVGDPLPTTATATVDDSRGVMPLCTRAIQCPFHDHNLTDVVTNGRPTVLLVATPGFCQTDICGPVVDLLIDAAEGRSDIDMIHAEVYNDPSEFETGRFPDTTDIVKALALPYEPVVFVSTGDGTIVSRIATTWDRTELRDALDLV